MKIAIQGHPTRGKEIILILKSLGATSYGTYDICSHPEWYWYINKNREITCDPKRSMCGYKLYTLEEFEKEFPFKIGETVITTLNHVGTIIGITNGKYKVLFREDSALIALRRLKSYKEMERNITLTLDKAKEWYKKGGELREIALQAFTERELNPLPRSWEEFVESTKFTFNGSLEFINGLGQCNNGCLPNKSIGESSKIWDKHVALFQLEQLRNCWWNGWEPEWDISHKYAIKNSQNGLRIIVSSNISAFLVFPTREMAEEFLKCFRDLIEKAGDLI